MSEDPWPQQHQVHDPRAIELLTDLRALRFLMPFSRRAHTLTSAAAELERPPSTLAYWIPRFRRAGLLVEIDRIRRTGASMPLLRTPARELTVAFGDIPIDRRIGLLDTGRIRILHRFLDGVDEALERERGVMLGFSGEEAQSTAIRLIEPGGDTTKWPWSTAGERPYTDGWLTMRLDESAARELAGELESLFEKYSARGGRHRYIVHAGVAREPKVRWRSAADGPLR